jgi:ribosomal RNA-processing protein 36
LARAQASLPGDKKKGKSVKDASSAGPSKPLKFRESLAHNHHGGASAERQPKAQRTSKHAPQEQSSKRPVGRWREVVSTDAKPKPRDPRFDQVAGGGADTTIDMIKARKAYAFLDEYRDSEMADLRAQIKKCKDEWQKEDLKRQLMSMESRKKSQRHKDEEERLLAEHRKQEKEKVAQGKQPFYLKKSEQKKRLLMDRYAGMSKGQVNRAIERKRKKVAGKEKKELGALERVRER